MTPVWNSVVDVELVYELVTLTVAEVFGNGSFPFSVPVKSFVNFASVQSLVRHDSSRSRVHAMIHCSHRQIIVPLKGRHFRLRVKDTLGFVPGLNSFLSVQASAVLLEEHIS